MRVSALILGIIGGLIEFVISGVTSTLVVVGTAAGNSPLGPHPGSTNQNALSMMVALVYAIPIASIVGGALAIKLPAAGGALMLLSALGLLLWLGINPFTIVPLACSALGGALALAGAASMSSPVTGSSKSA